MKTDTKIIMFLCIMFIEILNVWLILCNGDLRPFAMHLTNQQFGSTKSFQSKRYTQMLYCWVGVCIWGKTLPTGQLEFKIHFVWWSDFREKGIPIYLKATHVPVVLLYTLFYSRKWMTGYRKNYWYPLLSLDLQNLKHYSK